MTVYSVSQGGTVNAQDVTQFFQLLTGSMTDQPVTVANRIRAAMSGATAGSGGYVGQTTSGAPTTGTFNTGDWVVDLTGQMFFCTAGGSPGTWKRMTAYRDTQKLNSTTASVTFSSIPSTLREIAISYTARGDNASDPVDVAWRVNGDSGVNYRFVHMFEQLTSGSGVPQSFRNLNATNGKAGTIPGANAGANLFGVNEVKWTGWESPHTGWLGSRAYGGYLDTADDVVSTSVSFYSPAGPYTSITLLPVAGNFVSGSEFVLVGWE